MNLPVHSPLGASSAERWMNCPGSVALLKLLDVMEATDEPEYREIGTAAHEMGAYCLEKGLEAWECMGQKFGNEVEADLDMVTAVSVYLYEVRSLPPGQTFIEYRISSPAHPLFYGTLDYASIDGLTLDIVDYKHGEGVAVEVEMNPQFMYYAYGILQEHPEVQNVKLRVVQPRITWHPDGPVRTWSVSADYIREWARDVLIPAMLRTEMDDHLDAGPWCRFCPAKLVCPLLTSLFRAAAVANPKEIPNVSDESLGLSYQYVQAVKLYLAEMEKEAFARRSAGRVVPNVKLVQKKANRVFKPGAPEVLAANFGEKAFEPKTLKSPAEMEKISGAAKAMVKEWAYTPQTGLTLAIASDPRMEVIVKPLSETFAEAVASELGVANG